MTHDPPFVELEHTADLALRVRGGDQRALLQNAAHGLFSLLRCRPVPGAMPRSITHRVQVEAADFDSLLVEWLNELLYESARHQALFCHFDIVQLHPDRLEAVIGGLSHHAVQRDIKAATYHDLAVRADAGGYSATITFDV